MPACAFIFAFTSKRVPAVFGCDAGARRTNLAPRVVGRDRRGVITVSFNYFWFPSRAGATAIESSMDDTAVKPRSTHQSREGGPFLECHRAFLRGGGEGRCRGNSQQHEHGDGAHVAAWNLEAWLLLDTDSG